MKRQASAPQTPEPRTLSGGTTMLSAELLAFYRENGYVLVSGLLGPEEAAMYRRECHDLTERLQKYQNMDATWGSAREAVAGASDTKVLHCHNVQFFVAAFSRLIVDPRLTDAASAIIGSPNVQLHHT